VTTVTTQLDAPLRGVPTPPGCLQCVLVTCATRLRSGSAEVIHSQRRGDATLGAMSKLARRVACWFQASFALGAHMYLDCPRAPVSRHTPAYLFKREFSEYLSSGLVDFRHGTAQLMRCIALPRVCEHSSLHEAMMVTRNCTSHPTWFQ